MQLPSLRGRRAQTTSRVPAAAAALAALLLIQSACAPAATTTPRPTLDPGLPPAAVSNAVAAAEPTAPPVIEPVPERIPPHARPPSAADFQAALDRARQAFEVSGVELGVAIADGPIWSGGSGSSAQLGTSVTESTPFVIGSITKTFVAALALQLIEEGKLKLDEPVATYLPGQPLVDGTTIGQLLAHTSGIADVFGPELRRTLEADPDRALSVDQLLAYVGQPWSFPGATFTYSNTNYLLLGLIIEQLTGASLADEIQRRFLDPLELASTRILWRPDSEPTPLLQSAWASAFQASGSMSSTAHDMVRWGEALYGGKVLSPASLEQMLTFDEDGYGLGVQELRIDGRAAVGHTGLLGEHTALLLWLPTERISLAIMADRPRAELTRMLLHRDAEHPSVFDLVLRLDAAS